MNNQDWYHCFVVLNTITTFFYKILTESVIQFYNFDVAEIYLISCLG